MSKRIFIHAACAAALACALAAPAAAEDAYPAKPIRIIVPFPPAGGTDVLSRSIAQAMTNDTKWVFVVENKPGAGGNIGLDAAAHSPPDGYTLAMGQTANLAVNPALYSSMTFDPLKDFAPIALLSSQPLILVVDAKSPFQSLKDFVEAAKKNPGKFNMASAGNGTTSHLAGELFRTMAGIDITHVPYRGGAAAATDVVAGQVQMMIDVMPNAYPLVKSGRVRGLAVTTANRFPTAPEFPTIAEAALPGFEVSAWDGVFAPAGTPMAIVTKLNGAIRQALDDPQVKESLLAHGALVVPGTPEDFGRFIAAESEKWAKVVRQSGAKID